MPCFASQRDLDDVAETWNGHKIREVRNSRSPSGRPSVLYLLPELYGTHDYLCPVADEDIGICEAESVFRKPLPCDEDFFEMCSIIMSENNLSFPASSGEARDVYIALRQVCKDLGI